MNKIIVAGIGPGSLSYIAPAALTAISNSDVLVAGKRHLEQFEMLEKDTFEFGADMQALIDFITETSQTKRVCVAVSGDPGFYSLLDYLIKRLGRDRLEVIPGISSFQYLFCKLAKPWKDYNLLSLHGRETDIACAMAEKSGAFFLTDKTNNPGALADKLLELGLDNVSITVGENLSYEDEKITIGRPEDIKSKSFSDLCVVVIEKNELEI